ncbi:MAG: HAD family phosphatase [Bacteroidaceae bacterium]|nr:HAD family phosphatase [Bacteroidaceae bacterium]
MIKDIVFDFGGVLTTIDPNVALRRFAALGVKNPGEMINSYCQKGAFFALENGDITAQEFCNEIGSICGREITLEEAKHAWMGFIVEVHTTLLEYLQTFRGKYRLSVLSNTNPFIQSWACSPEFTPEGKSLEDYFDMLFFSFELNSSKPGHEIYRKMLAQGNMIARETLFLDDGENNINAAAELGIKTLKVENGSDWRAALEEALKRY